MSGEKKLDCVLPGWYYNLSKDERDDDLISACAGVKMSLDKAFSIIAKDRMRLISEITRLLELPISTFKIEK
jgi:hypothetical protein